MFGQAAVHFASTLRSTTGRFAEILSVPRSLGIVRDQEMIIFDVLVSANVTWDIKGIEILK
jgi:hypothetical protein